MLSDSIGSRVSELEIRTTVARSCWILWDLNPLSSFVVSILLSRSLGEEIFQAEDGRCRVLKEWVLEYIDYEPPVPRAVSGSCSTLSTF